MMRYAEKAGKKEDISRVSCLAIIRITSHTVLMRNRI
jgi:hypothetical protein